MCAVLAKKIEEGLSDEEQIELLKHKVLLTHPDFKNQLGILVSVYQNKGFWVYLDKPYETKMENIPERNILSENT